jgi:hypothetical protein
VLTLMFHKLRSFGQCYLCGRLSRLDGHGRCPQCVSFWTWVCRLAFLFCYAVVIGTVLGLLIEHSHRRHERPRPSHDTLRDRPWDGAGRTRPKPPSLWGPQD